MANHESMRESTLLEQLSGRVCADPALAKLNELAQETAGQVLVVLVRTGHRMVELHPAGGPNALPSFCQVFRTNESGRKRCLTCRSLVAFGATYRGLIEYTCHGGVSVVAAPAVHGDGTSSERVVVAACAFAHSSHATGWRAAGAHGADLDVDLLELKRAYYELPAFSDERLRLVRGIVDAAASVLGSVEERIEREYAGAAETSGIGEPGGGREFAGLPFSLVQTRDRSFRREGDAAGSALVGLVTAMVKRDPSMRYGVGKIALAACITPNHFSMLFHKHTGQTFRDFLTGERIALARELLDDPMIAVSEVARRAGFGDPAYFSRRFKQVTGLAPTEWRNREASRKDVLADASL